MRLITSLLAITLTAAGCCSAPAPEVDLGTPRATIESFHRAFVADDREDEYRCFSDDVRNRFGNILGYSIARGVFRAENQLLVRLLQWSDLEGRLETTISPDGLHAVASIDGGEDEPILVALAYEPTYLLVHPDGQETEGFAGAVKAVWRGTEVLVVLRDPVLGEEKPLPVQRVEIRPRWVIEDVPGLAEAFGQTGSTPSP